LGALHETEWEDVIAMKKATYVMMIVGALAVVPSVGWGLPPVIENPSCALTTTLDGLHGVVCGLLDLGDPDTEDIESVSGPMDGDGIPDKWQLGLASNAICADAGVAAQFAANQAAFAGFMAGFDAFSAQCLVVIPQCTAVGTQLLALPDPLHTLGTYLTGSEDAVDQLLTYFVGYLSVLPVYTDWFAAMNGLSSEMQATFTGMWADFFGAVPGYAVIFWNAAPPGLGQTLIGASAMVPDPLKTQMVTLGNAFHTLATIITGIDVNLPDFVIFGTVKTADEPFSGAGDYNGNGDTNKSVYDTISGGGGGRPEFIAAASGFNPWYTGNPSLPVAGVVGLALLAGVCAWAGAHTLRKK